MKHCAKKLLGLAFALALCLAVGGTALAETPVLAAVLAALPGQEMLADEPNVTTAADVPNTVTGDGYTVTIPTTVDVKSGENEGELTVNAQLKQYRTLKIGIESTNKWKLKYQGADAGTTTPEVDYKLSQGTSDDVPADCEWQYQPGTKTLSFSTTKMQPGTSLEADMERVGSSSYELPITVPTPSQATMSGTYSDTLAFTFDLQKQCVTYTINVYEQKLQLTQTGVHVQAVDVVDATGNVTDGTEPDYTVTLEYYKDTADATWTRPRPTNDEEDKRCWKELSYTLHPKTDFETNNKTKTIKLNLVRNQYALDVNGATDYNGEFASGNQGGRITGYVYMKVSVDNVEWSEWYRYKDGDDYWMTLPYGIYFKLGFHHVKNGYVYDTGTGTLESSGVRIIANREDTHTTTVEKSEDGLTTYYVYEGLMTGPWTYEDIYHLLTYCYIPCYKKGITYFANDGTEDVNEANRPRSNVLYEESGTLKTPVELNINPPSADMVFAGWSTSADYPTTGKLYQPSDPVSTVKWENYTSAEMSTRPKGDTQKRELYAIWKKPYTVKVQFGGDIGWTTWDAANQSFPENKQDGDGFDDAVELGKAYAYGNTSLTLSTTENKTVWDELQTQIKAKTSEIATAAQPDAVWQLKDEYTVTTLPANGEVTIQIKRKRYLLNVIPALDNGDGTFTVADNIETAKQYGKFDLYSCGKPQTLGGKISYYQWMRNYGGSYEIYDVVPNTGYQFVGFRVIETNAPVDKGKNPYSSTLTGKNEKLRYFGDTSGNTYTGDTIYVMYKKDMVTFDYNGGTSDGKTKLVLPYDDSVYFPQVVLTNTTAGVNFVGWSTKKNPDSDAEIFKLVSEGGDVQPGTTKVSSKVTTWTDENNKVLYAVWRSATGPSHAPAKKKVLTVHYHANFDPMEELALDLDPNPLLDDMDDDFGFEPDPLPEDVLDPTVEAVKTVTYKPDENVVLRHCMFKRGGYVFVGWNTEPDGTGKKYEVNGVPITDWAAGTTVDLYAQWEKPHHMKPVVDDDSQPGGADPAPTPQPGGVDDDFGVDPQLGGMDDAFGVDPAAQPEAQDDAFGIDPDPLPEELDDAFGV